MPPRKPVEPNCDGSVLCPVPGHLRAVRLSRSTNWSHIVLTAGQRKTLREQRKEKTHDQTR